MTRQTLLRLTFLLSLALFPLLVMGPAGSLLTNLPLRLAVFLLLVLGGAWLMQRAWAGLRFPAALLLTALIYGSVYKLASFIPDVSTYPFALSWSEISRYYYASLFFAEKLYGTPLPLSVLHPTRYLMQSLPFLLTHSPLWLHRLWQVILWVGMSGLASGLLWRRLAGARGLEHTAREYSGVRAQGLGLGFVLFSFLFLFQGPVYYHLLVMVSLILWGCDSQRPWRTLILVLIASLWAGVSRINWLPVPGMLAAALYFLERPLAAEAPENKPASLPSMARYLLPPALWVMLGTAAGTLSQQAYQTLSGNPPELFGSSFSSDLLWYRLLPNPTYPLGILPSAVLVSLPLLLLSAVKLWHTWRRVHPLRLLGLAGILLVLFAGGVVVSVKIGGGSNLHNLDAYLVLLLVVCGALGLGALRLERPQPSPFQPRLPAWLEPLLLALTVAIPLAYALTTGGALPKRDFAAAESALQAVAQAVAQADQQGGEVLFISQRHLLTLGMLGEITTPLVPDYELVFLMEMAMSGNRFYLDAFQSGLQAQRYALIVSGPLTTNLQGRAHSFGEENDAWVIEVSQPILCYYEPILKLKDPALMLLAPRQSPCK
jgi:hypothetical protein